MTRDTFSRFTPPDRGRFGDNEYHGERLSPSLPDSVAIHLYQHKDSPKALLLSRKGDARLAVWIPRSLVTEPDALDADKVNGVALLHGTFRVVTWKLDELGWRGRDEDHDQLELLK